MNHRKLKRQVKTKENKNVLTFNKRGQKEWPALPLQDLQQRRMDLWMGMRRLEKVSDTPSKCPATANAGHKIFCRCDEILVHETFNMTPKEEIQAGQIRRMWGLRNWSAPYYPMIAVNNVQVILHVSAEVSWGTTFICEQLDKYQQEVQARLPTGRCCMCGQLND